MRYLAGQTPDSHLYEVYLDGALASHCFEADDESGIIFCYEVDSEGYYVPERDEIGRVMRDVDGRIKPREICLRGQVQIRKRRPVKEVWLSPSKLN